jgi:ribosomal protein S18 acetylase RimI-like enzyme
VNYQIKIATPEDATAISELVNSAYRGESSRAGWTTEADYIDGTRTDASLIREVIEKLGHRILLLFEEHELIGCVQIHKEGERLYLGMLTVKPSLQNKGIGKIILKAAEKEAIHLGCVFVYMNVLSGRKELIDWYLRHGYYDTGKRKPFSFDDPRLGQPKHPLEFIILEKKLTTL